MEDKYNQYGRVIPRGEGTVYVASLQTTYLSKIFEIFKPEQIRKLKARGSVSKIDEEKENLDVGLKYIQRNLKEVWIDFDIKNCPVLDKKSIKAIMILLKRTGVDEVIVEELEVEIPIDYSKLVDTDKEIETNFIARFRNIECPNAPQLRENIKTLNKEIFESNKNNFRYRQLMLYYLLGASKKDLTYHRKNKVAIIDLEEGWGKKSEIPKWGSDSIGSKKTVIGVKQALGDFCVQQHYKLKDNKEWNFEGWN